MYTSNSIHGNSIMSRSKIAQHEPVISAAVKRGRKKIDWLFNTHKFDIAVLLEQLKRKIALSIARSK